MVSPRTLLFALLAALAAVIPASPAAAAGLRPDDPVVLTGAKLPALAGERPGSVVAFAWTGRWKQIPVQVDERAVVDFGKIYNGDFRSANGQTILAYADPAGSTGPDPDAGLDADDEVAFMAGDAAGRAPKSAGRPSALKGVPAAEVRLRDPVGGGKAAVYLFARAPKLDPGAGRHYVSYRFSLLAGAYPAAYRYNDGPNPENSVIKTKAYEVRFSDRWQMDSLRIRTKGASGADILDRARAQFAPGSCGRSEDTFDDGEGAFVANKSGPVRAIRSYVGANSGPLTQREHIYYADRQDVTTYLRVHAIPSVMEVFDYAPEAIGMTYRNDLLRTGVRIDGVPDTVPTGTLRWEQVSGAPGTLTIAHRLDTSISPLTVSSYYADTATPAVSERPCTGDTQLLGTSGPRVISAIPNTDPRTPGAARLVTTRTLYVDPPGGDAALADRRAKEAATPLVAKARPLTR